MNHARVYFWECDPSQRFTPHEARERPDPVDRLARVFGWDRMKAFGHLCALKSQVVIHREDGVLDGVSLERLALWFQVPLMEPRRVLEGLLDAGVLCAPETDRGAHAGCPLRVGDRPRPAHLAMHLWDELQGPGLRRSLSQRRSVRSSFRSSKSRPARSGSGPKRPARSAEGSGSNPHRGQPAAEPNRAAGGPLANLAGGPVGTQAQTEANPGGVGGGGPPAAPEGSNRGQPAAPPAPSLDTPRGQPARFEPGFASPPAGGPPTPQGVDLVSDVDLDSAVSSGLDHPVSAVPAPATAGLRTEADGDGFPPCPKCDRDGKVLGPSRDSCACPRGRDRGLRFARGYGADREQAGRATAARKRAPGSPDGSRAPAEPLAAVLARVAARAAGGTTPGGGAPDAPPPAADDPIAQYQVQVSTALRLAARRGLSPAAALRRCLEEFPPPRGYVPPSLDDTPPAAGQEGTAA